MQTPSEETNAVFSPDGRWVAYVSLETDGPEIYVRAFPGPSRAWRISTSGGSEPFWRRDGRELYYRSSGQVMAVAMRVTPDAVEAGRPAPLFPLRGGELVAATDGQRFLAATAVDTGPPPPITVIVNWQKGVSRETAAMRQGR